MNPATGPIGEDMPDLNPTEAKEKGILSRFAHLFSAPAMEGLAYNLMFSLSRMAEVRVNTAKSWYAIAAGAVVMKVVQFGLYYPLVAELGRSDPKPKRLRS